MAPNGPAYNVDWVASNTSNVHVATHRDWFDTYTEFPTQLACIPGGATTVKAQGIGTVILETRAYEQGKKPKPNRTITLNNVLYVPNYVSNVFAFETEEEYAIGSWPLPTDGPASTIKMKDSGRLVGLVVRPHLMKLWLKGQSKEQTSLEPDSAYYIHASWPDGERARWKDYQNRVGKLSAATSGIKAAIDSNSPLTDLEKKYLKEGWGSEFKFLQAYGLKIHDEDDRAEGRNLLRRFMSASDDEE